MYDTVMSYLIEVRRECENWGNHGRMSLPFEKIFEIEDAFSRMMQERMIMLSALGWCEENCGNMRVSEALAKVKG